MDLKAGSVIYDPSERSIGLLIRRFKTYEDGGHLSYSVRAPEFFRIWVWDIVWSKSGRSLYSEEGLHNLIKEGAVIIIDNT